MLFPSLSFSISLSASFSLAEQYLRLDYLLLLLITHHDAFYTSSSSYSFSWGRGRSKPKDATHHGYHRYHLAMISTPNPHSHHSLTFFYYFMSTPFPHFLVVGRIPCKSSPMTVLKASMRSLIVWAAEAQSISREVQCTT